MAERSRVRVLAEWRDNFGFESWQSGGIIFFFFVPLQGQLFVLKFYFGIRSTPVLPQQQVQDPGHSAKSAGGRLQLNTHARTLRGFA